MHACFVPANRYTPSNCFPVLLACLPIVVVQYPSAALHILVDAVTPSDFNPTTFSCSLDPRLIFTLSRSISLAQRSMLHSASSFSRTTLPPHSSLLSNPPSHPSTQSSSPSLRSWCFSQTRLLASYSTSPSSSSHFFRGRHTAPVPFTIQCRISASTTEQLALATHKIQQHRSSSSSSIHTWPTTHHIKRIPTSNHINSNRHTNNSINNNNNNNHRSRSTERPSFLGQILLLDDLCNRPQTLQQTTFPSHAMFSSPKASTANIVSTKSRPHLAHENSLRGRQRKYRTRKRSRRETKSTLSVAIPQGPCSVSLSPEQSDKKTETSQVYTLSEEISCSPITPLPTANTAFDAFTSLLSPLDGTNIMATLNDNHSAQLTTLTDAESTLNPTPTGSTSPGSRPKPSPTATTALRRSTSLSHSATIKSFVPEPMEGGGLTSTEISAENHLNNECFPDEDCQSGRDSGIAIESWGRTSPKADKNLFRGSKDPFPSFDQLFQSSDLEPTGITPKRRIKIAGYNVPMMDR